MTKINILKIFGSTALVALSLLFFQNCGEGFQADQASINPLVNPQPSGPGQYTATLTWEDPNMDSEVAGYNVYYGVSQTDLSTKVDVGKVSPTATTKTFQLPGLTPGRQYYFAVTVYGASGESGQSAIVAFTPPAASL
jgi:hypothetical protein